MWISVAACLAIIVGALVYNARQEERFVDVMVARIQETAPDVKVIRAEGDTVIAVVGMDLFAGDRIETKKGERVILGYPNEKTTITAGSAEKDAAIRVGDTKDGKRLHLEKGILDASVAPQPPDKRMIVTTPHAKAEVRGTRFSLRVDGRLTRIEVFEGLVRFTNIFTGVFADVSAGHYAVAGRDLEPEAVALDRGAGVPERYVEGPVIFEDDFSDGLVHWEPYLFGLKDGVARPLLENVERHVRIEEVEREGRKVRRLILDTAGLKDTAVAVRLRRQLGEDNFAVAGDLKLFGYGKRLWSLAKARSARSRKTVLSSPVMSDSTQVRRGAVIAREDKRFVTSRNDEAGEKYFEVRIMSDDKLGAVEHIYCDRVDVDVSCSMGRISVERIVVRRLIREGRSDEKDR
jgi:hypothetical protein